MKTILTAASFALTLGLSGIAHAGFNDQGPAIDTTPARTAQQDLSFVPAVTGFNMQSHHAAAAVKATSHQSNATMALGANCELSPRVGFQNSNSVVNC